MRISFTSCACMAMLAACSLQVNAQSSSGDDRARLMGLYKSAVINSCYTDSARIWDGLVSITDDNPNIIDTTIGNEKYVLVVTWKAQNYYAPANTPDVQPISTKGYDLWVTAAPELKTRIQGTKPEKLDLRLEQMLGLPPLQNYYKYFFEFWVRPKDLYRPCPDSEIADNRCQLAFPPYASAGHIAWIDSQRISRFFGSDPSTRYPWTELGYTYDWAPQNPSHHGCSEFVVKRWSTVYQRHFYTTAEYIYR